MIVARLLGWYLAFALRTTSWTVIGAGNLASLAEGRPAVVAFWHERLALLPALWVEVRRINPDRRYHVLVSRHQDGRFVGEIMGRFGIGVVHGSRASKGRDRGGAVALRALLGLLGEGAVGITPDGPKGPRRVAAAGVAQLAALSGAPVVPIAAQVSRRMTLKSWDRMVIPLPFGRGVLVVGAAITVARDGAAQALPAIEAALTAACEQADAAIGVSAARDALGRR